MYKITAQKFEDPADGEATLKGRFAALHEEIGAVFRALEEEYR
jgi:V-type H+-transporting ATPase subunit A